MEKYKKLQKNRYLLFGILVLELVLLLILLLIKYDVSDGWLGFWGGVIGSIVGVVGAILILNFQMAEERKQSRKDQIDNTFFNLLEMHVNLKERIGDDKLNNYYFSIYEKLQQTLTTKGNTRLQDPDVKEILQSLYLRYIQQMKEEVIKLGIEINAMPEDDEQKISYLTDLVNNNFHPKTDDETRKFHLICSDLRGEATQVSRLIKNEFHVDLKMQSFWNIYNSVNKYINDPLVIEKLESVADEMEMYKKGRNSYFLISENERKKIINTVSNNCYSDLGAYFRLTHRIIKYINDSVKEPKERNNYLGFFRSTIEEYDMLVIFYNAYYTERGKGLGKELSKTSFFGKKGELGENNDFIQHFSRDKLFWPKEDLKLMRDYT